MRSSWWTFSSDGTERIAKAYDACDGHPHSELPEGVDRKTWAVWNGYLRATGDLLSSRRGRASGAPGGLERLIATRERRGGAISAIPYTHTEKFY
jgi:hypothetical protein